MKLNAFWRRRYFALVLLFICVAIVSLSWSSRAFKEGQKERDFITRSENMRALHAQIRDGLGKEIKFADTLSTDEEVRDAVESVAGFIRRRSGLQVSEQIKEKLVGMENEHLAGNSPAISSADLADALTATAIERLSNVSDAEIDQAAAILSQSDGEIILRGNGRGRTTSSEFVKQTKIMRDMSRQGDLVLRDAIHKEVESAVTERVKTYSRALPTQFGEAETKGVTPTQAVLITYSLVSDDLMAGSKDSWMPLLAFGR